MNRPKGLREEIKGKRHPSSKGLKPGPGPSSSSKSRRPFGWFGHKSNALNNNNGIHPDFYKNRDPYLDRMEGPVILFMTTTSAQTDNLERSSCAFQTEENRVRSIGQQTRANVENSSAQTAEIAVSANELTPQKPELTLGSRGATSSGTANRPHSSDRNVNDTGKVNSCSPNCPAMALLRNILTDSPAVLLDSRLKKAVPPPSSRTSPTSRRASVINRKSKSRSSAPLVLKRPHSSASEGTPAVSWRPRTVDTASNTVHFDDGINQEAQYGSKFRLQSLQKESSTTTRSGAVNNAFPFLHNPFRVPPVAVAAVQGPFLPACAGNFWPPGNAGASAALLNHNARRNSKYWAAYQQKIRKQYEQWANMAGKSRKFTDENKNDTSEEPNPNLEEHKESAED